jgi:uncharacterized membrane protein YfcA
MAVAHNREMEALWCVAIGIAAGMAGGMFGIGGGVIIVPALVLLLGYGQHRAQGTSLVALLMPVGLLGVMNYYREQNADLVKGAWIGLGFLAGAFAGSRIALGLDPEAMRRCFALFLIAVGLFMLIRR